MSANRLKCPKCLYTEASNNQTPTGEISTYNTSNITTELCRLTYLATNNVVKDSLVPEKQNTTR